MSLNAPQTLSVKRKRNDVPVQSLLISSESKKRKTDQPLDESTGTPSKRLKGDKTEGRVVWRLSTSIELGPQPAGATPSQTPTRRFHVTRASGNVVLFEKSTGRGKEAPPIKEGPKAVGNIGETPQKEPAVQQERTPLPRRRPGRTAQVVQKPHIISQGPSEETIRKFEKFSHEVETGQITSPSRVKPHAPKLRFRDRHPELATPRKNGDPDAMEVDGEDYVYDTYIREIIMPDAEGKIPEPQGTVGYIMLTEEDEEWWYDNDQSDKEFDTDDEDSNAEEYYANDYPEDELSSEDEFDRGAYRHYHGEDNEEYDLDDEVRSDEDEEQPFRQAVPKPQVPNGYWGRVGEQ